MKKLFGRKPFVFESAYLIFDFAILTPMRTREITGQVFHLWTVFLEEISKLKIILGHKLTTKNSLQDVLIKSVPIFDFQDFLFDIVVSL